jgi:hypothetical protein
LILIETAEYFGVILFKKYIRKMHCIHRVKRAFVIAGKEGRIDVLMQFSVAVTMKEHLKIKSLNVKTNT